jgi:hypothetical protein
VFVDEKDEWHWVANLRRILDPPAALGRDRRDPDLPAICGRGAKKRGERMLPSLKTAN